VVNTGANTSSSPPVNCEQAANLISARLDGEIAPADLAALHSHEATCPACRATAQALVAQDDALTSAFTHRRQSAQAVASAGATQEALIVIHGGYEPATIRVRSGMPVRLTFDRLAT